MHAFQKKVVTSTTVTNSRLFQLVSRPAGPTIGNMDVKQTDCLETVTNHEELSIRSELHRCAFG